MSQRVLELESERLILRIAEPIDLERVLAFRLKNRAFLEPWLPEQKDEAFTSDITLNFLKDEYDEFIQGKSFRFLISPKEDPETVIGDFRFSNVVRGAFQSCYLGYLQDEAHCGRGYMQEALSKGIWYMFAVEGLHRVEANIMPRNEASIKLIRRLGFHEEGYAKRYLKINGVWEDHLHFALLNE